MCPSNRIKDAFSCIEAGGELKASTRKFLLNERISRTESGGRAIFRRGDLRRTEDRIRAGLIRRTVGAACAVLTLFLCFGGYALLWMPVSYVSIDVNPSLELVLNRLDRVIYMEAYNEDGASIAENVSVKGMYYTDAIDLVVESDMMRPYLRGDAALTITVAADSGQREDFLFTGIQGVSGCREHRGISIRTDISMVDEAHGNGFSLGKYAAYRKLLEYDGSVTMQDCHDMSMSQLHLLIKQHEHGSHGSGYGSGQGTGRGNGQGSGPESGASQEAETERGGSQESETESGRGAGAGHGSHHRESGHGRHGH